MQGGRSTLMRSGKGLDLLEVPDFLDADECGYLIRCIDRDRAPSRIFENRDDADRQLRTSETCWMDHSDAAVRTVQQRISDLLGIPADRAEALQGQYYAVGRHFRPHHDFFRTDRPYWPEQAKLGGQRSWTAMIFLNAPEKGGETHFPLADIQVRPQPGLLLAWDNMGPDGLPNPQSLHEGRPVESGSKYIVTQWFRERPCRRPGLGPAFRRLLSRTIGKARGISH